MPRGKRGSQPAMIAIEETGVTVIEEPEDPTAEEIAGTENVVEVQHETEERKAAGYKCANCQFTSNLLSEIEEHVNGTGHGKFDTAPVKPELFSTLGVIQREIKIPLGDEFLNDKKSWLAALYQSALEVKEEKKIVDSDFNLRLKNIDESMQQIAKVLRKPYTYETVECEWRVIDGENSRELRRCDTGEVLETSPLTEEDRVFELDKAAEANAEPVAAEAE